MRNYTVFKDFNYINALIFNNLYKIPNNIDIIIGIPRSGMLIGSLLGEYLNKPCVDLYSFKAKVQNINLNSKASKTPIIDYSKIKNVLLVDDTVFAGTTMKNAIEFLSDSNLKITTYCVFIKPGMTKNCNIYCSETEHMIPWNIMKVGSEDGCWDMDGVLCEEVPKEFDDDGEKYKAFISNSRQLYHPERELNTIVTSRLEKYRSITEKWLKEHGIRYKKLIMLNVKNMHEKNKINTGEFKAQKFKESGLAIFIESSLKQAMTIKEKTGKPIFCTAICDLV